MSDESLDPARLLASADLDNEVSADERAQVEANPALIDEREYYRGLRERIASVDVPDSARESAIAAALAQFDQIPSPPADPPMELAVARTVDIVALRERNQRRTRWLGAAAAIVVIAVVGIGIANRGSSDNDSSEFASLATSPNTATKSVPALEATSGEAADQSSASIAAPTAESSAPADTTAAAAGTESAPELTAINGAAGLSAWVDAPSFTDAEQLAAYVESQEFTPAATTPPAAEATTTLATSGGSGGSTLSPDEGARRMEITARCGLEPAEPSRLVIYIDTNAIVVRDDSAKQATVVDAVTCDVLATISLP